MKPPLKQSEVGVGEFELLILLKSLRRVVVAIPKIVINLPKTFSFVGTYLIWIGWFIKLSLQSYIETTNCYLQRGNFEVS